jgi:hypothetical protein
VLRGINGNGQGTISAYSPAPICADISFAGPAVGTLTWVTTSSAIEVAGGATVAASGVTMSPILIYTGSSTHTITTNSVSMTSAYLAGTGTYTLGSAYTTTSNLYFCLGTFSTANFALTVVIFDQDSSTTRTINLGSSTVTISGGSYPLGGGNPNTSFGTNVTFNAGTSQVNFTSTSSFYISFGLNKTWYNVSLTNTSINKSVTGGIQLGYGATDTPTFNNFSIAGQINTGVSQILLRTSMTINGTFTIGAATSVITRLMLRSNVTGTARTITTAAFAAGATDVDWMDIAIAGAAGTITGTRFGNCGGCTNITFAATKTVYWNLAGAQNWSATGWATSSGGSPALNNFPLAQDTAVFDNTGSVTGTITIDGSGTNQGWNIGTVDMSARTSAMTLAASSSVSYPWIFGSWINGSGVTISGVTGVITFSNRSTKTINSAGKTFTQTITIDAPGGGLQLLTNNLTVDTTATTTLTSGTLDLNNLTLSTGFFDTFSTNIRTLAFGTGNITCTGNSAIFAVANFGITTNLTITGTPVCNITTTSSLTVYVALGIFTSTNAISFNFTGGTYTLDWTYPGYLGTYKNLNFTGFSGTLATRSTPATIYGDLTLSSTMTVSGYTGTITFASTGATNTSITTNGVTINGSIVVNNNTSLSSGILSTVGALTCTGSLTVSGTSRFDFGSGTVTFASATLSTSGLLGYNGPIVLSGSGTVLNVTTYPNGTYTDGTPTLSLTSASPKTAIFPASGSFYGPVLQQSGAGALTLNTTTGIGYIQIDRGITNTVSPTSILVTAGLSLYTGGLILNGTPGNLVTFGSTSAAQFSLGSIFSGVQTNTYCSVSYVNGLDNGGLVYWRFLNSTNGGNNTNLTFASLYYWVGGSGTWNNSSTTNWSLTSGGAGGAGVPTAADDVIFNSSSNTSSYVVSNAGAIASCFNLTIGAPASGSVSINPAFLYIYGNFTATSSSNVSVGSQIYYSNSFPATLTPNGVTFTIFNNLGTAILTLGGDLVVTVELAGGGGGINTSTSNYSITTPRLDTGEFGAGTFTFNASTITITGYNSTSIYTLRIGSSCTVNAGTSTINVTGANTGTYLLQFGGKTFYNVTLNNGNYSDTTYNITDTVTDTFNTFIYNPASAPSLNNLVLSGNITTNYTTVLNIGSNNYVSRLFVRSATIGTQRTITSNAQSSISYVDFRDIAMSAGVWVSSSSLGDCGGNSLTGTSFSTAKTVYWNLAGTQNWSATGWATASGGTPAVANFPLAQDNVYFDNTGSAGTVTIDNNWNIGLLNMSNRTSAMTLATSTNTPTVYGSWTNGSGTTLSGTGKLTFSNRSTKTINSAGKTFTQDIVIDAPGGGIQLLTNNLTTTGTSLLTGLTRGTLDLNSLTLTCQSFSSTNTNTRTLAFGTGQINVTGSNSLIWDTSTYTNLTVTGTPTVNFTYSGSTGLRDIRGPNNSGGSGTTPLVNINITAGSDVVYLDNGIFGGNYLNVNFTGFTGIFAIASGGGVSVYGNFTLDSGMTTGTSINNLTFRATSGSQVISTNGVTVNFPIVVNAPGASISTSSAFTSTSSFSIISNSSFFPGGTFTVNSYASSSTQFVYFNYQWTITGSGACFTQTGVSAGVSYDITTPLTLTSSSPKTFAGGGSSFGVINQGGAGELTITGTNTFADIQASSLPSTIIFPASVTTTVSAFTAKGTAGNLLTLQSSSAGTQFNISKSSGTVIVDYLSLKDSNATGGAIWRAGLNSTIVSNVSGWLLLGPPTQIRASINSSGVLYVPGFNQLDEVSKSINSLDNNALYSNLFDETQSLDYNGIPVAQRKTADGKLLVSGYFDETTLQ